MPENLVKNISLYKDENIAHAHSIVIDPDDEKFKFHTHSICEIIFIKSGNVSAIIGEKTYKLQKGSLVIFRANIPHKIRIDSNENYERHNLLFDHHKLANGIFYKLPKELDIINLNDNTRILDLFDKFDYYYTKFKDKDLKILVHNTIEELLYNLYAEPFNEFNVNRISTHPIILNAVEYINENYTNPITIDEIAKKVCVTKSHLHHLFVKNLKISPKKYINMKRLSKAKKLIISGKKPTSVFSECGFTDYGTFFRNYLNHFGFSPSKKDEIIDERIIEL